MHTIPAPTTITLIPVEGRGEAPLAVLPFVAILEVAGFHANGSAAKYDVSGSSLSMAIAAKCLLFSRSPCGETRGYDVSETKSGIDRNRHPSIVTCQITPSAYSFVPKLENGSRDLSLYRPCQPKSRGTARSWFDEMTSKPDWGLKTSALNVAEEYADRIKGKNIIVTGVAPQGVGEGTALAFASQQPANLLFLSRTKEKLEAIADIIRITYPGVSVRTIVVDLASQKSIRKAVQKVKNTISTLDILVNNAGVTRRLRHWTEEGIEMQFGVNHIGTFLLTSLLFPLLKAAAEKSPPGATRVINLSSHGHMLSPIRFHDYNMENKKIPQEEKPTRMPPAFAKPSEDGYLSTIAYAQSKTANILFTLYLQEHARASGIMSYRFTLEVLFFSSSGQGFMSLWIDRSTGLINEWLGVISNLGREHDKDVAEAIAATSKYWKNSDEGASTSLVAALDPALDECRGLYLADCQFFQCAEHARSRDAAQKLWELSEKLIGDNFIVE
ncbi:hypothetical protein RRF57_009507 [Xylaria bambusicola]|uniref:Uncharacterized protein n=1 Tax=Xylaria bambusicola TaxID=326684 RepID=A0AAN7UQ42_9PEZI